MGRIGTTSCEIPGLITSDSGKWPRGARGGDGDGGTPGGYNLFFLTRREDALGVASSDDLPSEPVADALRLADPSPLSGLVDAVGAETRIRPLRDATCRSFPVWELGHEVARRIAGLEDAAIDAAAERWLKHAETSLDADLYELASCLTELRDAIRAGGDSESLFVLLEERAW